jgi:tRNA G46 methylase TrmB
VHIFFPDPWHKKKHNKRRLIQPALVAHLASRLAPGGYLHCATDWQPYAEQMLQVLGAEPLLTNTARLRAAASLSSADQVRKPRPAPGPRRVGSHIFVRRA